MGRKFEQVVSNSAWDTLFNLLVKDGIIKDVRETSVPEVLSSPYNGLGPDPAAPVVSKPISAIPCSGAEMLSTKATIEAKIEDISRRYIGTCEPVKDFKKALNDAIKQYGHDELLEAFDQWAKSQGNYIGNKPVNNFLKNAGSYVGRVKKPSVVSENLLRAEKAIALISDNKVYFSGMYRLPLAQAVNTHGFDYVIKAFEQFYQDIEDKRIPWAAKDFLERVDVMIAVIKKKEGDVVKAQQLLEQTYRDAAKDVEEVEEGEDI